MFPFHKGREGKEQESWVRREEREKYEQEELKGREEGEQVRGKFAPTTQKGQTPLPLSLQNYCIELLRCHVKTAELL